VAVRLEDDVSSLAAPACAAGLAGPFGRLGASGLDPDDERIVAQQRCRPFTPLSHDHGPLLELFVEAEVEHLARVVEPPEVDVYEVEPGRVGLAEHERRARDDPFVSEPASKSLHERGLTGAEASDEQENVARL
jgi:hypothetical protein